ncbi:hypothetical protein ZYGR_0R01170 [Zygosaccharomyces rouxii]|uniref:ZYRO0F02706p n=2 Tax=Zygosaccharomyces rouxii TaxID=4956 RepID=C5DX71_ZYGRC|nr:uncharacterized protein ZYRO0F02706g [Zygosaccharomyces rouxii]KAH9199145.1 hypothetical protein LQ764DRAFT_124717 [Zygosaccharomyces rouxii]GAV49874.1 hypothetical protein ZYGR_0R01170 [Zygosaccharomyces rouxii]CAR28382.1 ZYRO0F02706p [Zygosaccharomyces rouxii]
MPATYNASRISAILSLCGFIMGMDVTSLAVFLDKPYFNDYFHYPGPLVQGALSGAHPLGGLTGCLVYSLLCDKFGRVGLFRLGSLFWLMGSIIAVGSINTAMVIASRWIKGTNVGILSILLTAYCSEVISPQRKGRTLGFVQFACSFGILSMFCMCILLNHYWQEELTFRLAWSLETLPCLFFVFGSLWLPESPTWLTTVGRYEQAQEVQNHLAVEHNRVCGEKTPQMELLEKLDLAATLDDASDGFSYLDLFTLKYLPFTAMAAILQLLVQFSGISVLMYYAVYICEMVGLQSTVRSTAAAIPYAINVLLTLLPPLFLDRLRRKDITLAGAYPLALIMISLSLTMLLQGHRVQEPLGGNAALTWTVSSKGAPYVLSLCYLFVSVFSLTLGAAPWLYTCEILPVRARSKGLAVSMAVGWATNCVLTLAAPWLFARLQWAIFLLLGSVTLLISAFICAYFPDTVEIAAATDDAAAASRITKPERANSESPDHGSCTLSGSDDENGADKDPHNTPHYVNDSPSMSPVVGPTFKTATTETGLQKQLRHQHLQHLQLQKPIELSIVDGASL